MKRRRRKTKTGRSALEDEALGLLGLAQRAGALVTGTGAVRDALRSGDACLVIMARDASPGQLRKVEGLLRHREIPVRWVTTRDALGRALGRHALAVVAVMTDTFAEQLSSRLSRPPGDPEGDTTGNGREAKEESSTDAGR